MTVRRLAIAAAVAGAALFSAPAAHAEEVCVTHDLRPRVQAYGIACVDTTDPNLISCGGRLLNSYYICA